MHPDVLFIGTDAIADNLRDASRRAARNIVFARLSLENAPAEIAGLAHTLTVLFPWGSLLRAVAHAEREALQRLRALCKPGAEVRFVFEPSSDARVLESRYREAGLALSGRTMPLDEAGALPTAWAKKLGYSGRPRTFWEFRGKAAE